MVFLPHWPIPHGKKDIKLGLERIKTLLSKLGNPHSNLPPTIHVAGTNGKGSTIAFLKAIFEDANYGVHRYISPHLTRFNERITINGKEITDDYLYEICEEVRAAAVDLQTTFFEGTTVVAFLAFAKNPSDVLLLETGMGGRLDATNVIQKPLISVITPISYDHCEFLGDTLTAIATEKAGIIKPNSLCISGWQFEEVNKVIYKKCNEVGTSIYSLGKDWNFEVNEKGFIFHDFESRQSIQFPKPSLEGMHQYLNASLAVAVALKVTSFNLTRDNIINGLLKAEWPGRLQRISKGVLSKMLPENFELWVDGAHNDSGALMISSHVKNNWQDKSTYLINGRTLNRDIESFLSHFKDVVESIYAVKVQSEPLSESAKNIEMVAKKLGFESQACSSLKVAITKIIKNSKKPCRILISGSLYLVGDVMAANKEY